METQNIKLGAFVLGGITLFLVALFYLGTEGNIFNKTFSVSAIFKNVEGLKEGDNVWLSGVKIGTVKAVRIFSEGKVIVTLSLKDKQNQFIRKDATAYIGSDGLVGNKIVVIRPGSNAAIIHDNDTINSLSPTDTQELINLAKEVGVNARSVTDDLKTISERLNSGEGILGELLHEGPVSADIRATLASLRTSSENANALTRNARDLITEVKDGEGLFTKLLNDTTYAEKFDSTITNIALAGENARKISEELREVIKKMNNNDNALGVLLADTVVAAQLKTTLENAQSASLKLDENMEALQHNFLFKGYFRRQKKEAERKKEM